jgi:hypothetical protein
MDEKDKPAFPQMHTILAADEDSPSVHRRFNGLTKRELFAAMAMQGILSAEDGVSFPSAELASLSIDCADALLAELSKPQAGAR